MPVMTTPTQEVLTNTTEDLPLWNPMTPAIATADLKEFRVRMWFAGLPGQTINVEPGLQFSGDGVTWGTVQAIVDSESFPATDGWVFDDDFESFNDLFDTGTYTGQSLFVRFGAKFTNTSDSHTLSFQSRLRLETRPVASAVVTSPQVLVYSNGSTTQIFQAVTDWIPSLKVAEARVSFEVLAIPGGKDIRVAGGYQIADDPTGTITDGSAIGDFANTTTYGGEFSAVGQSKSYTRLGLFVKNNASTDLNVGSVAVRIEYRN